MTARVVVILSIVCFLFIGLFVYSSITANSLAQKMLEEQKVKIEREYSEKIADLQTQINNKEAALKVSQRQQGVLTERLRRKDIELRNIKPPINVQEAIKRLEVMGYVVTIR